MKKTAARLDTFKESIFATMSKLAMEHGAINIGQGFPDFEGPEWVRNIACEKIASGSNQYAPYPGSANLRKSLSELYKKSYNLDYDWDKEISISAGATEAIFATIMAIVNPGDEVIVFEPFYDSYYASIIMAGGIPVPVTLHAPTFSFDEKELKNSITAKTKLILLNTPHNPTGKMFSKDELLVISKLAIENDLYVMSDEVYEYLTFDKNIHIPIATLPGMKERTITISSSGKTFGLTGWKIGWAASSPFLSEKIRMVRQYTTFAVATPFQEAMADAYKQFDSYLPVFRKEYTEKRDFFFQGLVEAGFKPLPPQGTYFLMCPISNKTSKNDVDYCMELITQKKVVGIPPSVFYLKSNEGQGFVRFCFAKKHSTLENALENLKTLKTI